MRIKTFLFFFCVAALLWLCNGCVKPYEPPEIAAPTSLLVVDGMLQTGANAATTILLSRTRKLADTATTSPEQGALLLVESESGERYALNEITAGNYYASGLPLNATRKYRVFITTSGGSQYASDYVTFKETPPIDSVTWEEANRQVGVFVYTHDAQNATRYYRWAFTETWEYRSFFESFVGYENGVVFFRDSADLRYKCWRNNGATNILLGTSDALTADVINRKRMTILQTQSEQLSTRYSILVQQFALTKEAFEYWQILQKNTEQRGSIFDAQPSQLSGNLHCITNPGEPVVGFLSASSVTEKRLFVKWEDIQDKYRPEEDCPVVIAPSDSIVYYLNKYKYKPAYYITGGGMAISTAACVDCTLQGGTNIKPSFW